MSPFDDDNLRVRVLKLLDSVGVGRQDLQLAVLALLDDETPSPLSVAARRGHTMRSGASTAALFARIAPLLGKAHIDRENRDKIMLPLREVDIMGTALYVSDGDTFIPDYWNPKSNYCVYVVRPEVAEMLETGTDDEFDAALKEWGAQSAVRKIKIANAQAAANAALGGDRLVPLTIEHYCRVAFSDWEVVYVDDADGDRIRAEYAERVKELNVPLNLGSRWPDIILHKKDVGFWIVDCVKSDGEIDEARRDHFDKDFGERGLKIVGMTTVYETFKRYAERQKSMKNIAANTYIWILEEGGTHLFKEAIG